jgi:glutamate-5-semialdehyde dehydrogenase
MTLEIIGRAARKAFNQVSRLDSAQRAEAVRAIGRALETHLPEIETANRIDIEAGRIGGLSEALVDRLTLTTERLQDLRRDVLALAEMPDPVGEIIDDRILPNGLRIRKQRVPLGVIGAIYESRPNVTVDIAALAVKTGNAAILRGGKETLHSNRALMGVIHSALEESGLPIETVQFIDSADRALVGEMLRLNEYIDVIVPRGGNSLHEYCRNNANIPVITGGIGICHLFVDASADLTAALALIHNAKTQRPSVCNALDTLLVHQEIAADFLPQVVAFLAEDGVTFRADKAALAYLADPSVYPAGIGDFDTEWLSLVLGLKVVSGLDEALDHIQAHSTFHSDGILTEDDRQADRFVQQVDSAAVFVNASTRFNDGAQLGLGAEVAVSTQRLHARGPMGLPELTTYKWVVRGDYSIRG